MKYNNQDFLDIPQGLSNLLSRYITARFTPSHRRGAYNSHTIAVQFSAWMREKYPTAPLDFFVTANAVKGMMMYHDYYAFNDKVERWAYFYTLTKHDNIDWPYPLPADLLKKE